MQAAGKRHQRDSRAHRDERAEQGRAKKLAYAEACHGGNKGAAGYRPRLRQGAGRHAEYEHGRRTQRTDHPWKRTVAGVDQDHRNHGCDGDFQ